MMRRERKWVGLFLACVMLVLCVPQTVWATEGEAAGTETEVPAVPTPTPIPIETNNIEGWPQAIQVNAETACLIDANTGAILYNKGMTQRMYPASTTKVMTALVVLENASLDEVFTFTETGVAEAYSGSSNLFTQVGEQFTVEDALYALMLKSANDFASQIAEYVGGSVENFVQMMNDKAAELGCVNTHFNNAHGLPDENHYSCAYDLALIMQEASKNPDFCRIAGTLTYVIPATHLTAQRTIETHNGLIMEGESYYEGSIAGKTGYTDAAWCTYVSVAERNGMKLIEATMKAPNNPESFLAARQLYDYGFQNFQNLVIKEANEVYSGGMVTVPQGITEDSIVIERGELFDTTLGTMVNETYYYNGYQVGTVAVSTEYIEQIEAEEQARVQQEEAEKAADLEKEIAEQQAFDEKLKSVFRIIGVVLLVGIAICTVMIVMAVLRIKRRRKYRRRRRTNSNRTNRNRRD